jgi:hypothetical protein
VDQVPRVRPFVAQLRGPRRPDHRACKALCVNDFRQLVF